MKSKVKRIMWIVSVVVVGCLTMTGCASLGTNVSPQGGVLPQDEEFNISVPKSITIKQGEAATATVSLQRGADFKRDVWVDITAEGISVAPDNILIRASDRPDVEFRVSVTREAAIGDYRVLVRATPKSGKATSTKFTVKVISQ